ncbi:amidase [Roseateles violae]|uniref:Amidase n=1 Tax=Roseateles violae TaxID=3058042 RepID=A0ABT8DSE1_9BURK|nr:amidase [Pelomonas sp. PFR6]MDN3919834.1 amidase [Pelomonas sp. PFR6]
MSITAAPDLSQRSALELAALYRSRETSPVEATQAILAHIEAHEPVVNAFALLDAESALAAARASEQRWLEGRPLSPIDGVPAAIKDLLLAKGWPTLRGSRAVNPDQPWDEDSPATARLREQGAVLLGKTTTAEFGWKALADSPLTGITRNPWNRLHTPGGSSGGSAAAAALGFGPLQVATDGGGSTRLPAAHSGAFGFKPSFGRVPGYPAAHTGTLFHITALTRTVRDAALLLNATAQPDLRDFHALPPSGRDWLDGIDDGIKGLRIAFSPDLGYATVDPEVAALVARAVQSFAELGAVVDLANPGIAADPLPIHRTLANAGVARLFETWPVERRLLAEPGLQAVAERGRSITGADFVAAVQAREALARQLWAFHTRWDLLLTPTTTTAAPLAEGHVGDAAQSAQISPFAYPFNLSQQPAASVPIGFTRAGLPVGLQIVGPRHREDLVLRAARAFEQRHPFAFTDTVR